MEGRQEERNLAVRESMSLEEKLTIWQTRRNMTWPALPAE